MTLYDLCFDYLETLNLLSKPEIAKHVSLKEQMQKIAFVQKEISKKLNIEPDRLKLMMYNLDVFIDFNPPVEEYEKIETYAHNLDYSFSNKTIRDFLHGESHKITTKYGILKDDNKRRFS